MTQHSKLLAPSGASIWLNCGGAGYAQLDHPELFSQPAIEGTATHMHAEMCEELQCHAIKFLGREFNGIEVTQEQCDHVQEYLDLIRSYDSTNGHRYSELRGSLPDISDDLFGTMDFAAYDANSNTTFIADLKYGFEDVTAMNNPQLWIYGLMFLEYLRVTGAGYPEIIQFIVFQPRSFQGEVVSTQSITANDLYSWRDLTLIPAVNAVESGIAPRTPGKHCKHCKAKINCPEYLEAVKGIVEPPFPLEDSLIREILEIAPSVKKLGEQAEAYGIDRLQRGFSIPGIKMVKKTKHNKIDNESETIKDLLEAGAEVTAMFKQSLKTPAQLKKSLDEEYHGILANHTYKPEGGVTIKLMDDNRPAVPTTKEVFKNVTKI